jgi:phage baseplate assembly protein gpV
VELPDGIPNGYIIDKSEGDGKENRVLVNIRDIKIHVERPEWMKGVQEEPDGDSVEIEERDHLEAMDEDSHNEEQFSEPKERAVAANDEGLTVDGQNSEPIVREDTAAGDRVFRRTREKWIPKVGEQVDILFNTTEGQKWYCGAVKHVDPKGRRVYVKFEDGTDEGWYTYDKELRKCKHDAPTAEGTNTLDVNGKGKRTSHRRRRRKLRRAGEKLNGEAETSSAKVDAEPTLEVEVVREPSAVKVVRDSGLPGMTSASNATGMTSASNLASSTVDTRAYGVSQQEAETSFARRNRIRVKIYNSGTVEICQE